jgi:hypothetical protein
MMRPFLAVLLVALLCACSTAPTPDELGRVMIVDARGVPLQNGVLTPDLEHPPVVSHVYDDDELKDRASDAHGVFHIDMDDCIWESDECYHFRIHLAGYDDAAMVVSRDLFPPMLKVVMQAKTVDTAPQSAH